MESSVTTTLVATHGRCSFKYVFALLAYYCHLLLYYPLAHALNRSYILHHPDQLLPVPIAPPRNRTIHSFTPDTDIGTYLTLNSLRSPRSRQWMSRRQITDQILSQGPAPELITLDGELHGPLLRQGMLVYVGRYPIYIRQEFGRLPTREDLITTDSIVLGPQVAFPLFIPIQYIDVQGLPVSDFRTPFQETTSLLKFMQTYQRLLAAQSAHNSV